MGILDGLARHLDAQGLATWSDTGILSGDWPVAIDTLPQSPDQIIVLSGYGGPDADSKLGYDLPRVQVRVRGGPDPRTSRDRCLAIYGALQGLGPVTLPDGTLLLSCIGLQSSPQTMGTDSNNRHEHVINFECEIRAVTTNRV